MEPLLQIEHCEVLRLLELAAHKSRLLQPNSRIDMAQLMSALEESKASESRQGEGGSFLHSGKYVNNSTSLTTNSIPSLTNGITKFISDTMLDTVTPTAAPDTAFPPSVPDTTVITTKTDEPSEKEEEVKSSEEDAPEVAAAFDGVNGEDEIEAQPQESAAAELETTEAEQPPADSLEEEKTEAAPTEAALTQEQPEDAPQETEAPGGSDKVDGGIPPLPPTPQPRKSTKMAATADQNIPITSDTEPSSSHADPQPSAAVGIEHEAAGDEEAAVSQAIQAAPVPADPESSAESRDASAATIVEPNAAAMGDIRSAFAFLDSEGGREGSIEPTGGGANTPTSNKDDVCIEVNLVRNRLSIFERLSQQTSAIPLPAVAASRPLLRRVASPLSAEPKLSLSADQPKETTAAQSAAATSFSERVRRLSEQEAVIYEGLARNAAEDHEEMGAAEVVGGIYPNKTQQQENVINEYTRKHSNSQEQPVVANTKSKQPAVHFAPIRAGYSHQPRAKISSAGHAQQSPTMENIQRSLGLTEDMPLQSSSPLPPATAAANHRSTSPEKADDTSRNLTGRTGGGVTYNLQKSGFSVTLKGQRSPAGGMVSASDPAARKQVYNQYRELLKKFSHHREETV